MSQTAIFVRSSTTIALPLLATVPTALFAHRFLGATAGTWSFWICAAWVVVALALTTFQLHRWEEGASACCKHCSGPLSWMTWPGKKYYGKWLSEYRNCWNCGKANGVD